MQSLEDVRTVKADDDTEQSILDKEKQVLVQKMLRRMPPNYRDVVCAFYLEEKSHKQIAGELGVAEKTVASRLYRARKWMQKHWQKEDFE